MFFKAKGEEIKTAISGQIIPIDDVESPIFAGKVVGDGVAIIPNEGKAVAPISGVVSFVGDKSYSYGITGFDGVEVLIHIGIGTGALDGEGYQPLVKKGDQVAVGDAICNFDLQLIKDKGLDPTTPIIITSGSMENIKRLTLQEGNGVAGQTTCMRYVKK